MEVNSKCCKTELTNKRNKKRRIRMLLKVYMMTLMSILTFKYGNNMRNVLNYSMNMNSSTDEQLAVDFKTVILDTIKTTTNNLVNKSVDFLSGMYINSNK